MTVSVADSLASEVKNIEEKTALHKQAFRTAFDLLNEAYPPEGSVDYWTFVGERFSEAYNRNADNPLARELIVAVCNYLEGELLYRPQTQEQEAT